MGSVNRREVLAGFGGAVLLAGCGTEDDLKNSLPKVNRTHVALTPAMQYANLVLLKTNNDQLLPVSEMQALAAATGVTIGFAASLVPELPQLRPMPKFSGDVLIPARTQQPIILLAEAETSEAATELITVLQNQLKGTEISWQTQLSHSLAGKTANGKPLVKNVFNYTEGYGNQTKPTGHTLLSHPTAFAGGSLLALRIIQVSKQLWDHETPEKQNNSIGRTPDGTWLDGTPAEKDPKFYRHHRNQEVPLTAHVRAANPHTKAAPVVPLQRRSWNYQNGSETGAAFMAFTNDLANFETIQRRVIGDALSPYTATTGGGYYYVP